MMDEGAKKRFWDKVDKTSECWLWTAATTKAGYGQFGLNGRSEYAHRLSYRLLVGPIPKGLFVLHTCDNPPCVRPAHLWVGTNADNLADSSRKGRMHPGEKHGMAKLKDEAVIEILESRESHAVLSRRFGVHINTILAVRQRKTWTHIDVPAAYYEQRETKGA